MSLANVLTQAKQECGFLSPEAIDVIAKEDRLRNLLIRWHEGRALVPAQNVKSLIEAAQKGGWCVRDVSLPASDPVMRG